MATNLDLEEQEQLDDLKHFWKKNGNIITWVLIAALAGYAAWNGWNYWQREQAVKASAIFDELDRASQAGDVDKVTRVFADLKERYPSTAFTQQGGLLAAKAQFEKGKFDAAQASLTWVGENAIESEYKTVAFLRLAGVLLDAKKYDEALKQLDTATAPDFAALVADRRGDVLLAQGKAEDAKASYNKAWTQMDTKVEYRRLIEAKLTALGAAPEAVKVKGAAASEAAK